MNTKRDLYWDTLKFVLIFTVVYVHTISPFSPDGSYNRAFYSFQQLFAMPLFIFISGRFSHIRDLGKYKYGMLRIVETYLVFQIIRSFMPLLSGESLTLHMILSFLLMPKYTLWYLVCLVLWRLLVMLAPKKLLSEKPFTVLSLCFAISILGGFIPFDVLSIQRAMTYLPFFFMGYYSTEVDMKSWFSKIHFSIPATSLLAVFLFIYYFLNINYGFVSHGKTPYWSLEEFSPFVLCMFRCLYLIVAVFVSFMIMCLIRVQPYLAKLGEATLTIYVFHAFLTQGVKTLIMKDYLPGDSVSLLVYAIIITLGIVWLSRLEITKIIQSPVSYFIRPRY